MSDELQSDNLDLATEMHRQMGLAFMDLSNPTVSSQLAEITQFLENEPDPNFVLRSVLNSKKSNEITSLDHMLSFVRLSKEKNNINEKLSNINKELEYYA